MKSRTALPKDRKTAATPPVTLAPTRRRRRRWSEPARSALLAQFAANGQSAAAFCRAAGLCAVTFSGWRRREAAAAAGGRVVQAAGFATVQLAEERPAPSGVAASCLVQLPNGIRITVTSQIAPAWLGAVLSHLR